MAKTERLRLERIADWHNVAWALGRACRGKRRNPAVQSLLIRPEYAIVQVSASLRQGRLPVGGFKAFAIRDPKPRTIHAAPLLDRVAHHALIRYIEPVFERVLLDSVFACRPGRGVHAAIRYAQRQSRRYAWVMHMDIARYFPGVDHEVLKAQLRRRFRGEGLALLDAVIDPYQAAPGCGLPIGALTSQHFANHYLNEADRWCLARPGIRAHCRYMDDILLWADDRRTLRSVRNALTDWVSERLGLRFRSTLIQRSEHGLIFLGIHLRPDVLRPNQRRRRLYRGAVLRWQTAWLNGEIDDRQLQTAYASANAILLPADDSTWRRRCLSRLGVVDA